MVPANSPAATVWTWFPAVQAQRGVSTHKPACQPDCLQGTMNGDTQRQVSPHLEPSIRGAGEDERTNSTSDIPPTV